MEQGDPWVEQHLHEQFAKNYNSISRYIVAFVAAIVVVFTAYACALCHLLSAADAPAWSGAASSRPAVIVLQTDTQADNPSVTNPAIEFALAYLAVVIALCISAYLCIMQGWTVRRDQFLIYAIRKLYFNKENRQMNVGNGGVFSTGYHPFKNYIGIFNKREEEAIAKDERFIPYCIFDKALWWLLKFMKFSFCPKGKRGAQILVGTFNHIYNICTALNVVIALVSIAVLLCAEGPTWYAFVIPAAGWLIYKTLTFRWIYRAEKAYILLRHEYSNYNPKIKTTYQ